MRSMGAELFYAGGRIDGLDEANSRFSKFCERAWKRAELWSPSPTRQHDVWEN